MDSKNTDNFLKDIKNVFDFFKKDIKLFLIKDTKTLYDYKTNILDGLLYLLLYTQKGNTYTNSAIQVSKFNNINTTRQSFDKRSSLIKLNHLNKIINQFYHTFLSKFSSDFNITDGVVINVYDDKEVKGYKKIILMSVVDSKNCSKDLHINKDIYKSEIKLFYDLVDKGHYDFKKTFLLDALYFSDKLTNNFYDKQLKFISRMKKNSVYLNNFEIELKKGNFINDYEVVNNKGNKIRIINYKINNKIFHLATNPLDKQKYKVSYFKNVYKKDGKLNYLLK